MAISADTGFTPQQQARFDEVLRELSRQKAQDARQCIMVGMDEKHTYAVAAPSSSTPVVRAMLVLRVVVGLVVACARLVVLVTMHLALYSLRLLSGPRCSASWPV